MGGRDFTKLQTLILGCEEPELYQHPPQAKLFATALQSLTKNKTQVIVSTHSPYFITAKFFENIRVIRRTLGEKSKSYRWSVDENCALIAAAKDEDPISTKASRAALNQFLQPQMNEMFFSPGVILVEGEEDKAIISRYFQLSNKDIELLNRGVEIIPVSGKGNLINAISIARGFEIPFFAVFDGDMNCTPGEMDKNVSLNKTLLSLSGHGDRLGSLDASIYGPNFCIWKSSIQDEFDDLPAWQAARKDIAESFGWKIERLKKNAIVLEASLEQYLKQGSASHLEKLSEAILAYFIPAKDKNENSSS